MDKIGGVWGVLSDVEVLTESGLSLGLTRAPSKRNRTEEGAFPWRSQKAFMSFERAVVRLILKKTSLLLSVTLMLRCSLLGCSSALPPTPGDWSRSDMVKDKPLICCAVVDNDPRLRDLSERNVRGSFLSPGTDLCMRCE